jgi:hypothetical protein
MGAWTPTHAPEPAPAASHGLRGFLQLLPRLQPPATARPRAGPACEGRLLAVVAAPPGARERRRYPGIYTFGFVLLSLCPIGQHSVLPYWYGADAG